MPEIRFDCVGSVTSWSGHTLVLTRENFLEILTHTITFQVWRPSLDNKSYTLVGSNHLTFQGQRLSDGIKPIENQSYIAYFSFTEPVPGGEQVSFIPGDVVGWYYPPANGTNDKPLSILYTNLSQQDNVSTLLIFSGIGGPHVLCNVHESSNSVITSVLPLISAAYGESSNEELVRLTERVNDIHFKGF